MPILSEFRQALREFMSPDSAELTIGSLKLKYSETLRADAAKVAALFRAKRVLTGNLDHELWMYVFPSLEELRNEISLLSGKLHAKGTGDVSSAVDWIVKAISLYLSIYQADYTRFMEGPTAPELVGAPAHKERNWPALGDAARDLLELRSGIAHAIQNVNAFADSGSIIAWEDPEALSYSSASRWIEYAKHRSFCPTCGFNLIYGEHNGDCPRCPPSRPTLVFESPGAAPWKEKVFVAGTFTEWQPVPMDYSYYRRNWRKSVDAPPGKYLYKFFRDGVWFTDPSNPVVELDQSGNLNSVFVIREMD